MNNPTPWHLSPFESDTARFRFKRDLTLRIARLEREAGRPARAHLAVQCARFFNYQVIESKNVSSLLS